MHDIHLGSPVPGSRYVMPCGEGTGSAFRVLTYNILAGGGSRLNAIEAVIRASGADLVGLQEVHRHEPIVELATRLGMHIAITPATDDWSVAALCRWPLTQVNTDNGNGRARALLEATVVLPGAQPLRFFVTHLSARYQSFRAGEYQRLREIAYILERMRDARERGMSHLLVGDFNSLAPGEPLHATRVLREALRADLEAARGKPVPGLPKTGSILPPFARPFGNVLGTLTRNPVMERALDMIASAYVPRAVVSRMHAAGYTDCYAEKHPDASERLCSCPVRAPAGRIDYIFADPTLASRLACAEILRDTPECPVLAASDHAPALAAFRLS